MLARCSHCGAVETYDEAPDGGAVKCRACGREFTGGVIPEHIEIPPDLEASGASPRPRRLRHRLRARATLAGSLTLLVPAIPFAGWYATIWSAPGVLAGTNYACLVVAWAGVAVLTSWARPSRIAVTVVACALLASATIALNAWYDRYDVVWTVDSVTYRDTHGRWNPRWNYRRMTGDDPAPFAMRRGPMSASWRPHGRWILWLGTRAPLDIAARSEWYWEGEPISEVEWEARGGRPDDYRARRPW
jgi:hypothetical protein